MKKKIYIAGAGGMLGKAFYEIFKDEYDLKCSDIDVNEDWLEFLDFRNEIDYADAVQLFKPDYLFHLGAHTNLEWCELNQDDTYLTNTLSVENATRIANSLNIPLLYISTAGIFDGKQELYDDWDTPNPLGAYARSKYMGERYVCENSLRYIICRAGWMMGGGPQKDKKFINKLVKQVEAGATELNIVNDKDGTPTYTYDFAKTVKKLIELELWGLYNCVCHGQTSRYEVAEEFLRLINREDIKLNAVNSDFFKEEYFAQRPASERLITKKLELRKVSQMQDWRDALKIYLQNEFNHIKK
jgi:dTDP-4-dehydrorhamnose reductase